MFAADDVKDGVDDDEGLVLFSSCKTLYIDYEIMITRVCMKQTKEISP